jgi:hypothetical protein
VNNELLELAKCFESSEYFIDTYCMIYDATEGTWIPFKLWPEQKEVLAKFHDEELTVALKARQLGLTWLALSYALWLMMYRPVSEIGLFSRRETEAIYLLSKERLQGIFEHLPEWMKAGYYYSVDSAKMWQLNHGSATRAFPTSAGDSYTFTLALVDEADLAPDLKQLMTAVKPTIDAGNKMFLISRSDKSKPNSHFKKIYKNAKRGLNNWSHIFLPWWVRPSRTKKWYDSLKRGYMADEGTLDTLHEQYPSTDTEALQARTLDKRIPPAFLRRCYEELEPIPEEELPENCPTIPGLKIYVLPEPGQEYVIGADPAEGNPNSDPSAATVLDSLTGEEMAVIEGRIEPTVFASYLDLLGRYYNDAFLMIERNNHGHAVIAWLVDNSELAILEGHDASSTSKPKLGWLSSSKGKSLMYNDVTDAFRDQETILHSFPTFVQLASIEGATLLAPAGEKDDRADSYALAIVGAIRVSNEWLID